MVIVTFIVLGVLSFILGPGFIIGILIMSFFGWLLCDIDVETSYSWYSGIWHGLFFVPNFIRSLIWDVPYKAEIYSTAYNIFYWIVSILSSISSVGFLFGCVGSGRRQ